MEAEYYAWDYAKNGVKEEYEGEEIDLDDDSASSMEEWETVINAKM